ncbi:MAG: HD-GYP domain-containing protein [Acidobacteria bacterium]|nr:HD-GYP domain-containing protein [Acidobacteriota bacterium]
MEGISFGDGYVLRSLQNVDAASAPVQAVIQHVFLITAIAAVLACLALSALSSSTIIRPIASLVSHLKASEKTGDFPEFTAGQDAVKEIRELMESFNRSVAAIRQGRDNLHRAYVEFVGSLANALDARDPYTAGHSRRVSEYACSIARAIELSKAEEERLRIGSLLHDIGKIGIADHVLQKPGRLTPEEFAIIKEHPTIGRRILEGVHGFQPYLSAVELHHENWDGSGYPRGQANEETPLEARIVHVADAYDAMTSDRPYRRGMSHEQALRVLQENAGTQFDPAIVSVFVELDDFARIAGAEAHPNTSSVERLAAAVDTFASNTQAQGLPKR